MQYSHFDECIDLLETPIEQISLHHPENSSLLRSPQEIAEFFVEPLTLELEKNLLDQNTLEQKVDLITFYISRLMKSKNHRSIKDVQPDPDSNIREIDVEEIGYRPSRTGGPLIMYIPDNPNDDFRFMRGCNILYHLLFDALQRSCDIYDIPFTKICIKIGFPLNTINVMVITPRRKNSRKRVFEVQKGAFEKLNQALQENGFFNLPKVMELNEQSKVELVKLICLNDIPYIIAMFDFLGFINYFLSEYAATKTEMYKNFSEIFCSGNKPVSVRTIQGNFNDLNKSATKRDARYTSSKHKEEVQKHYEALR